MNPLSPCQITSLVLFTSGLTTQKTIHECSPLPDVRSGSIHLCFADGPLHYQEDPWQRGQSHNGAEQWQICFLYYEMLCYVLWMLLLLFLLNTDNCRLDKIKARVVDLFRNRGTIKFNWKQGKTFVASNTMALLMKAPVDLFWLLSIFASSFMWHGPHARATHTFFKFIHWTIN